MAAEPGVPLPMVPDALAFTGDVSPCRRNACRACCMDTEMPLLASDVVRLEHTSGRSPAEFSIHDPETGETRLRNRDGHCIFLGADGCTVYADRPAGCRIYPLVFDPEVGAGILDEDCPYRSDFSIRAKDQVALQDLVASLLEE